MSGGNVPADIIKTKIIVNRLREEIAAVECPSDIFLDPHVGIVINGNLFVFLFFFCGHAFGFFSGPGDDFITGHVHGSHEIRNCTELGDSDSRTVFAGRILYRLLTANITEIEIFDDIDGFSVFSRVSDGNSHRVNLQTHYSTKHDILRYIKTINLT